MIILTQKNAFTNKITFTDQYVKVLLLAQLCFFVSSYIFFADLSDFNWHHRFCYFDMGRKYANYFHPLQSTNGCKPK